MHTNEYRTTHTQTRKTVQDDTRSCVGILWGVRFLFFSCVGAVFFLPLLTLAAEDTSGTVFIHATVRSVSSVSESLVPGTDVKTFTQIIQATTDDGEYITIENDRVLLEEGDTFFASYIGTPDGGRIYAVHEPDRRSVLILAGALFAVVTVVIGGVIGLRSLVAVVLSGAVIFIFLLPQLAHGAPPLLTSVIAATGILALAMGVTHGLSKQTAAAFVASIGTITFAVFLGDFFVQAARLSGFVDDTTAILNLTTGGSLNLQGLFLASVIIGTLGVIDDLAMTQVSFVTELADANQTLSWKDLYRRAMNVGKEHLGAVTNTLVFAYAGVSMPLLLLFVLSPTSPLILINSEIIAAELVRTAIGGTALALVIPIATLLGIAALKWPQRIGISR